MMVKPFIQNITIMTDVLHPVEVHEVNKHVFKTHILYLKVEERACPDPYGKEVWAFLCDKYGYKYVYSLPVKSTKYLDGYLDGQRGDWYACAGGMGYNELIVKEKDLIAGLEKLGYKS